MRKKLDRAYQNEKSISEYAHELEELFNMIGSIDEREQVVKFWKGCKPVIQKALWRDGLNPDVSSWDEVTCKAEIIEISENVMDQREKKGGDSSSKKGGFSSNNPSSNKGKSSNSHSSSSRGPSATPFQGSEQPSSSSNHRNNSRNDRSHLGRPPRGRGRGGGNFSSRNSYERVKSEPQSTPQLSEKELEKRRSEGLCYHCGGSDYISRNCPEGKSVNHTGNKPPGKTSFSVELGAIGKASESSPEVLDPSADPEGRFNMYPSDDNSEGYVVDDAELDLQSPIPKKFLFDPTFDLISWYCYQLEKSGLYNSLYLAKSLEIYEDELAHLKVNNTLPNVDLSAQDEPDLLVSAMDLTEDLFEEDFENLTSGSKLGDPPELQALTDSDSEFSEVDYHSESELGEPPDLQVVSDSEYEPSEMGNPPERSQEELGSSQSSQNDLRSHFERDLSLEPVEIQGRLGDMGDAYSMQIKAVLNRCQPYPGDIEDGWATLEPVDGLRFIVTRYEECGIWSHKIVDNK